MKIGLYILVMAGVTYLIRMLPFAFFQKRIRSVFIKSFLHYIPYAVLAAMTVPAILDSTDSVITACAGAAAALILAYFDLPLIVVALSASLAAFGTSFFC